MNYLAKPFAMPELVAGVRVRASLCRKCRALTLGVGDLRLELVNHALHRDRRKIELSAQRADTAEGAHAGAGRVFTRTELCERVWEHAHEYDTNWWKFSSDAYDKNSGTLH